MADVFISYAREDKPRIEFLVRALESAGIGVWWDQRIAGGADFVEDTEKALNDAAVCVVCWTLASVGSRWVRDEAGLAAELGKLLPVQLDGERPPMGLRQYQTLDMSGWSGDAAAPSLAALVDAIRLRMNKAAPAQAVDRSIAVLPFVNLSGDSTCQNFCDAVGADIISLLARNKDLRVLARGLSFAHRGGGTSLAEIGQRLNVRYIIDGTIRRSPTSVRITADLVLSANGQLLWSGQTEGRLDDVFALQDEMARYLAGVVAPELGRFEREAAARKSPDSLTAWECSKRGEWHLYKLTYDGAQKAQAWFARAIGLDASFGQGHAGLAQAYVQLAFLGAAADRQAMLANALQSSSQALLHAPNEAYCHYVRARALTLAGLADEALAHSDAALAIDPSYAHAYYAKACAQAARAETAREALANFDFAIGLCVQDPMLTNMHMLKAFASVSVDMLDMAVLAARMSIRQHNATLLSYATLAAVLGVTGDKIAAAAVVRSVLERKPGYSVADFADGCFFVSDEKLKARLCDGLRTAGLA